tara:strand:- start:364 stop:513 length:150 start_codon:yes stop_codon:yes gene_type:complete
VPVIFLVDCLSAIGIKFGVARSPKDQAQAGGIGLTENSTVKEINEDRGN